MQKTYFETGSVFRVFSKDRRTDIDILERIDEGIKRKLYMLLIEYDHCCLLYTRENIGHKATNE